METETDSPQVTGNAPLYKRPEPLNPKDHGRLGLLAHDTRYGFAAKQHFVPVVASEFGAAACSYPIIFAGEEKSPVCVMGIRENENLFIPDLANQGAAYVPAYVRRYPFIAANAEQEGLGATVICIDRDSDIIGENPQRAFFLNGAFTDYANECIRFCQTYENDRMATRDMVNRLRELDLFEYRTVNYRPSGPNGQPGEPVEISAFYSISQDKLNALPVETYLEIRDSGILVAIMAHWISQSNWDRLIAMTSNKAGGAAASTVTFGRPAANA